MRTRPVVLGVTGVAVFLVSLNLLVMAVAFPALQASFPTNSRAELSWVINAHNIVFAALLIPAGRAADLWGRRRVFGAGLLIFAAGSAVCGAAPGLQWLVAGRVVQGIGSAAVLPASLGLLLAAFPIQQRATAVTAWGAISSLGAALGPALGASIVEAAQWRWVFYVYLPIALGAAAAGHFLLAEAGEPAEERLPDPIGVLLFGGALAGLALALAQGAAWGWSDPRILGALALAAVLLPAFIWRCAKKANPVLDLGLFRIRSFSVANLAALIFSVAFYGQVLVGILFLTSIWHYGILGAALAITPTPVTAALIGAPAGRLANRYGFRAVAVPGALAYAVGTVLLALFAERSRSYGLVWLPASLLLGVGIGISFPVLGAASVSRIPRTRFAVGGAVSQTARQIGAVLGVALAVAVLGSAGRAGALAGFESWYFVSAGLAVISAAVSVTLGRPAEVSAEAVAA